MDPALDGPADGPGQSRDRRGCGRSGRRRRVRDGRGARRRRPRGRPPAGAVPGPAAARAAGFAGRTAELRWLHALLPGRAAPASGGRRRGRPGGRTAGSPVALITGTAGVGKTTLAIRFARAGRARGSPTASCTSTCAGSTRRARRCRPAAALQWFFDALGVPPRHVPAGLDAQSALLRTLLDGKRMLLLLDNAHDADQVRPLLPGSPGCLVLVTSRSQLTGLVVADGARPLPLDVLDGGEAAELLARRLGAERVSAEPDGGGGAGRAVGRAAAGAERDLRAGRVAGRARGWPTWPPSCRRARPAGRAADRRGDHRPAGGLLLVGRQAQRARRRGCSGCSACTRVLTSPPPAAASLIGAARCRRRGPRWPSWPAPRC